MHLEQALNGVEDVAPRWDTPTFAAIHVTHFPLGLSLTELSNVAGHVILCSWGLKNAWCEWGGGKCWPHIVCVRLSPLYCWT